jgi:2-isopropylmalate synthase
MALQVRKPYYSKYFDRAPDSTKPLTNINTVEIHKSSRLVSTITGLKLFIVIDAYIHE